MRNDITSNQTLFGLAAFVLLAGFFLVSGGMSLTPTPLSPTVQEALAACGNQSGQANKESCYSNFFMQVAEEHDAVFAFRTLNELQRVDPDAIGCHFIGHGIGYGTYKKNPANWQNDFREISQECTYGAMHGVLELAISDLPDGLTRELLPTICGDTPRGDCNHIIGHLTLLEAEGDISEALTYCDVLTDGLQREFCESGVFMEHMTAFNLISHGLADESYLDWAGRVDGVRDLCNTFGGSNGVQCWKEIAHMVVVSEAGNAQKVFDYCNTAPTSASRFECRNHSIGILAAGLNFDYRKTPRICDAKQNELWFKEICYVGIVTSALSTLPDSVPDAIKYCENLDGEYRSACFSGIGNIIGFNTFYDFDNPEELCESAPDEYRHQCINGGPVNFKPYEYHPEKI